MKKFLIATALVLASTSAMARNYGMAGCGLGSMLLGDQKGMMQIFAATTNGTGMQTFGISTGTSNCTDGSGKTATIFIEANKVALANDVARGQGETLESLAAMYGCTNPAAVGSSLQGSYSEIFPSTEVSAENVNANIIRVLSTEKTGECQDLV